MNFKFAAIWSLATMAYNTILRDLLIKAIDDPDSQWDDTVLSIVDKIFEYSPVE